MAGGTEGTQEKATDVFRIFEDFFVNGMPCDRVNAVVTESDDRGVSSANDAGYSTHSTGTERRISPTSSETA